MKRGKINLKFVGIFVLAFALLFSGFALVSAQQQNEVCCEREASSGNWCQNVQSQNECDSSMRSAPTSCDSTAFCQPGTCVDSNRGVCMPNTPKTRCESEGGTWRNEPKDEIAMCRNGCCVAGDQTAFTTQTECSQIASDYGVDTNFRSEVTDETQCLALAQPDERGACVFEENDSSTGCSMTTSQECNEQGGDFRAGMLCSAPGLSDCAWTGNTQCSDDDVYFVDSCGNLANVYDEDMYSDNDNDWNQEMRDYWTEIQEPNETATSPTSSYGNCDYQAGTICKEYSSGNQGMPNDRPEYGDNVCADLGCYYDVNQDDDEGEEYFQHGESWCAQSAGTYDGIPSAGDLDSSTREEIANPEEHNVPGSRYYQLKCHEGDVIETACSDYRNEVCKEDTIGEDNNFSVAQCVVNNWRECLRPNMQTQSSCEAEGTDCKWLEGYRLDGSGPIEEEEQFDSETGRRVNENQQGSCVPLYPPGFDFWKNDSQAQDICSRGSVSEQAIFETEAIGEDRDSLSGWEQEKKIENCVDGCYSVPEYGKQSGSNYYDANVMEQYETSTATLGASTDFVSAREGYYCRSENGGSNAYTDAKTGRESDRSSVKCSGTLGTTGDDNDLAKRRSHIYSTHQQWLDSIQQRARMLGDCGVTPSIAGNSSREGSETVTRIFQKLNQDGTPKDGQNNTEADTIYEGDAEAK